MAGPPISIRVEGLRDVRRALRKLEDKQLQRELRDAHKKAAEIGATAAENESPKRTGRLAKSIGARGSQTSASVKAGTGKRVPYAGVIHFGWPGHNIEPNEFIYRGIEQKEKQILEAYERELKRVLKKAGLA